MAVNGTNYFSITIDSTKVDADLTDYPVYFNMADLGTSHGFWGNVASDGSDIRVTKADGTTEVPFELVSIDTTAKTGELHFKASGTLSSTSNTEFRVYYNSADTAYAPSATFGSQNVWTNNFLATYHKEGGAVVTDSSPNSLDGTWGGNLPTDISGALGTGQDYDGTVDHADLGKPSQLTLNPTDTFTITSWVKYSGDGGVVLAKGDEINAEWYYRIFLSGSGEIRVNVGQGATGRIDTGVFLTSGNWEQIGVRVTSSGFQAIHNGQALGTTNSVGGSVTSAARVLFGAREDANDPSAEDFLLAAGIDEVRFKSNYSSDNELSTEFNNQNSSSTFYTLSAEQSTVVAPTVQTNDASVVTDDATLNGEITDDGSGTISERGFYYGSTSGSLGTKVVASATNPFSETILALANGTYYFEAFATNETGESRGSELSFTISSPDVRYRITHNEAPGGTGVTYTAEISDSNYSGTVVEKLATNSFFDWEYDQIDERDIFSRPVQKSSFDINFLVQSDADFNFISDILDADQNRFQINFYIDGALQWSGKVLNDLLEYPESGYPYTAKIKAKDLSRLSSITSEEPDLEYNRRLIELIADCLKETGLLLPIRSYTNLTHSEVTQANDFLHEIYHAREAFETNDGQMSCMNVLENICRAYNLIIRQSGARWIIEQIPAVAKGDATQYDYDVNGANPVSSTPSRTQTIDGTTSYILPTSENIVTGALKKIESVYNHRTLIHQVDTEDVTYSSDPGLVYDTFNLQVDVEGTYRMYFSTDVEVDADTSSGIEGTAYIEVKDSAPSGTDQYLTNAGEWSTSQQDIEITMSGASGSMSGSFEITNSDLIGDLTEEIIVTPKWADANLVGGASQTVTEVRWRNMECYIFHMSLLDSSASMRYRYTRSGDYYVTEDVGTTVLGDGPTQGNNTASNGRPASSSLVSTVLEPGNFRIRDSGENVLLEKLTLRERVNMRRTALRNLRANMWVNYSPENLVFYKTQSWFFLGGYFSAKGSRWTANIIQLSYDGTTVGDSFEEITISGGGASGTSGSGGGSSSGGLTETDANDLYLRHDLNLSEVESKPAARGNLGLGIGTDVQAHSSSLDTYASNSLVAGELQQLQNINSSTISATQWGYVGNLNQNLRTTDDVRFNSVLFSESTYDSSKSVPNAIYSAQSGTTGLMDLNPPDGGTSGIVRLFRGSTLSSDVRFEVLKGDGTANPMLMMQKNNGLYLYEGAYRIGSTIVIDSSQNFFGTAGTFAGKLNAESSDFGGLVIKRTGTTANVVLDYSNDNGTYYAGLDVDTGDFGFLSQIEGVSLSKIKINADTGNIHYEGSLTSNNFADAAGLYTGADLSQDTLRIETIRANELRVKAFVAEVSAALYGEDILTKSRGVLSRDFTVPAAGSTATLYVEDLEGLPNTAVFENGDWVRLTFVDRSGGGLDTAYVWGNVTAYTDLSGGEQSWTFTTDSGTAGDVIYAGSVAIDYGTSGDNVIIRSVIGDNTPRDTQFTWTTDPSDPNNYTIVSRIGNLGGIANTTGSGLYGENTFLTGNLVVGDLSKTENYLDFSGGALDINATEFKLSTTGLSIDSSIPSLTVGTVFSADGSTNTGNVSGFDFDNDKLSATGLVIQGGASPFIEVATGGQIRNSVSDYTLTDDGIQIKGDTSAGGVLGNIARALRIGSDNGVAEPARLWVDGFVSGVNDLVIDGADRVIFDLPIRAKSPVDFQDYIDVPFLGSPPSAPPAGNIRIYGYNDGIGQNPNRLFAKFSNGTEEIIASA